MSGTLISDDYASCAAADYPAPAFAAPAKTANALLPRVFDALVGPEGYVAGLHRLDDALSQECRAKTLRFYYEEILCRSPENAALAQLPVFSPSDCIRDLLCSDEFMYNHDLVLLRHFSHLNREFFLHIPKSGGTTILHAFESDHRFCPIQRFPGYDNGWFPDRLFYLRNAILRLKHSKAKYAFIYGHPSAGHIIGNQLKRGWDDAFTVLRDPIDTSISYINYVLTLISDEGHSQDSVNWRDTLGLGDNLDPANGATIRKVCARIIDLILPDNPVCTMLGLQPNLESVLDTAAILDLKIVRLENINEYIKYSGISDTLRMNVSKKFIEFADLDQKMRVRLYDKCAEDIKFLGWITRNGVPGDGPWITVGS